MPSSKQDVSTIFDIKSTLSDKRIMGFIKILKGYHWHYAGAVLFLGLSTAMNTARFYLLTYFVDEQLPNATGQLAGAFFLIALGFVLLALVQGFGSFMSGRLTAQSAEGVARRLRNYMFDHLQRLSFRFHDKNQTGELIQRCTSDIDAVRRFFADQAIEIGRITLMFTINFIGVFLLHWQLALFSSLVIPVVVILSIFFFRRVEKAYDALQNQDGVVSATLQENLTGVRVVKAFARQDYEIDKFEKENMEKYRLGRRFMMMHASFWPIIDILTGFQLLAGYAVAALLVINGDISLGVYLGYTGMVIWIIFPMRNLGRVIVQMSMGLVSFDRLVAIIHEEREYLAKEETPPVTELKGEIRFENVNFEYEPNMPVLHNITFTAEAGKTVALLGSTGSGKTSLVNLLPRFYDYTSGSIKLDGVELREYPRYFLRANIGVVQQEPFLFSRSIRENITYGVGRAVTQEEIEAAARAAAVHDVILAFPQGYDTIVGERGVTLSGGQKQRVALARTILKNPKILILDDATSSVDTETESEIREALERMMSQRTSFIIAHRIQSVMTADLILVMDKGEIVQRGTHDELMQDESGIYRRIYDMQARIEQDLELEIASVGD